MIAENSGKIYRFKLDHGLGYGFAEVYDFTDELSMLDGRIVYVFNMHDEADQSSFELSVIRESGIAIGPIRLHKFPNTRGLHSWRYLFKTDDFLINQVPETKELQGLHWKDDNWENFKGKWYSSNYDMKYLPNYVDYEKVRHLETRIINSPSGVVKKFTMKVLIDSGRNVYDYYDLSNLGNRNMFVQMVNTYYSLEEARGLLKKLKPT